VEKSIIENYKDSKKMKFFIYAILFIILYGVTNTSVYYRELMPFGVGLVFSLFYIKFSGYYLSIIYGLVYVLSNFNINSFLIVFNIVLVLLVLEYIRNKYNYPFKKWQLFLLSIVSQIAYIIVNIDDVKKNLALFVSVVLGLLFLYSCFCFFDAAINRGLMLKLNLDEKICGIVILIIFIMGLASINIYFFNLGLIFVAFIILSLIYIVNNGIMVITSAIMGISYGIVTTSPTYISLFITLALVSIAFKSSFKYLSAMGLILAYILFQLFFSVGISYGELFSLIIGAVLFVCIPINKLQSVNGMFGLKEKIKLKDMIQRIKHKIIDKVSNLSVIFEDMNHVYKDMVKGNLSQEQVFLMLKDELINTVCKNCVNKDICFRSQGSFVENSIDTVLSVGIDKGKVLLIDIPAHLTSNCINLSKFVMILNNLVSSYKEYSSAINNLDTSRILIADQLSGVSGLLKSLTKSVDIDILTSSRFEQKIIEELSYKNIICLECIIFEIDIQTKEVTLIVKTDTINNSVIEKIVSKILANKMQITEINNSEVKYASSIKLITKPNYDIVYGVSTINKSGKRTSGDNFAVVKIDDGKYMASICDGMGSGDSARKISKLSVALIENFYKAGFENEIILSSVNKLLSLNEQENFSTIDLCLIDVRKNIYDFIKLGATSGYLKREREGVEVIDSSGLPVGVLENIKPHITRKLINPMDMLILVSDGITDSFEGKEDLKTFINLSDTINPQELSKEILNRALELNDNVAIDDMTVVCVRIFEF